MISVQPRPFRLGFIFLSLYRKQTHLVQGKNLLSVPLQKGGVPAAPSGTATLLRLSPNYQFYPRALLAVTHFRYPGFHGLTGGVYKAGNVFTAPWLMRDY